MATRYQVHLPPMAIGYLPVPPTTTGTRRLAFLALTDIFFFSTFSFFTYRHQLPGYVSVMADRAALLLAHLGAHRHARVPRSLLVERTGKKKQSNPSILSNGLPLFKELYKKQSFPSILSNGLLLFKELQETKLSINTE
jgi:hypothetical protein